MIKSMTGYGKAEALLAHHNKVTVEIKTLNGKSIDISIKGSIIPKQKELQIRRLLSDGLIRGSVDFSIAIEHKNGSEAKKINSELFMSYYKQIQELGRGKFKDVEDGQIINSLLRLPDIYESKSSEITESDWKKIDKTIALAIKKVNDYRLTEGKALAKDIKGSVSNILKLRQQVKKEDIKRVPAIKERILAKLDSLGAKADMNRLEQEIIYYVEKLDINEEMVRLGQHCDYFIQTLEEEELAGKKLGFIVQEMGREINTLGSKANNAAIQKIVVKMKDELDKIREQSLNVL